MAERHGGAAPALSLAAGLAIAVALLASQGMLGLVPPAGEGGTLTGVAPRYLGPAAARALGLLLGAAMVGWFGINLGLGGAALAALAHLPQPVAVLALGLPTVWLAAGGMHRWNLVAAVATVSALVLVGLVVLAYAPAGPGPGPAGLSPVGLRTGPAGAVLTDLSGFVGFAAVFSVRAPDFSVGLAARRDLAVCVALLCLPLGATTVAGVVLYQRTGSIDLIAELMRPGGLALGTLLVAVAVVGPTFTTVYSGTLALTSASGMGRRAAVLAVAGPGLVLAATRFDLRLVGWLALLAAVLPPVIVPMAVEAGRRRRGSSPRQVPAWTWGAGSLLALALTAAGAPVAPLAGLATAAVATAAWAGLGTRPAPGREAAATRPDPPSAPEDHA
jgi:hypothetical protein